MSETNLISKPPAAESTNAAPEVTDRKRILLVEGDGFTRLVLLLRLRLAGFGVDFTSNGILGLGKLRSCHPDILLVELKLCGLSGLELIKAARAEPSFANRPIYVFTHVDRMNRATRKEIGSIDIELLDKNTITREDLVQIFTSTYVKSKPLEEQPSAKSGKQAPAPALNEAVLSVAIEELVAGVREQSELFAQETGDRVVTGSELLSRVSSLASCAKDAQLPNLTRQAKALQDFLSQVCRNQQNYTDAALATITRAVEVMSRISLEVKRGKGSLSRFGAVFVDEAPYSNRAMEEALLNAGFEPVCFENTVRAREYLTSHRTDLIVANLVLPEAHALALEDIRRLPFHSKTAVLFGPEPTGSTRSREDLPMSAPRLDKSATLLAELVLKALNEVQSRGAVAPAPAALPGSSRQPLPAPKPAPSLPDEDSVELFARVPRPQPATAVDSSPQKASVSTGAVHPEKFSHLFTSGIPSEPIMRAEPGAPSADKEAESQAVLPVTSTDASQIDERPLETLEPSSLLPEEPQLPQPEPVVENQVTQVPWSAATVSDIPEPFPVSHAGPGLEHNNNADAVQESAESTPNYMEVMNNQLQTAPTDAQHGDASQPAQSLDERQNQRQDLAARVYESEMALYHAKKEIEQRDQALEVLQKQLAEAKTAPGHAAHPLAASAVSQAAQARCAELEEEVAALRQALEGLNGAMTEPQQASPEVANQVQELEQRLNQNAAELEKQKEAQQRAETELRQQLEAASEASRQTEAARQQAEARSNQLEQELGSLRKEREELLNKTSAQEKANADSSAQHKPSDSQSPTAWTGVPASELEQQVRQGVAALAKATADLAKERGERQRSQQRAADLNSRLQTLHQDLSRTLQAQREDLARIGALEEEQHQASQALDRFTADVEQHQAERQLAEEQLQKAKELNAQLRKDLSFFEEANKKSDGTTQGLQNRLEASLNATRENEARLQQETAERQRLADSLEEARRELQNQTRKRETIEQELKGTRDALREREAKLHEETAERQRLNQAQDSIQLNRLDGSDRDLEFSKIQSALQLEQVERKRQESQLARMRQSALDAAHAARALRTGLRRQIREPVDDLMNCARTLLEMEMGEEQKKLAEAVLQDVLLVQTRLKEPGTPHGDAHDPTAPPAAPAV
jgi:DNA-binding response OmpR family regulator